MAQNKNKDQKLKSSGRKDDMSKSDKSNEGNANKPSAEKFEFNLKNKKLLAAIPFLVAVIIYAFIWTKPDVVVQDPWYEAIMMVDSSQRVQSPELKKELMDKGGNMLRQLVIQHPYHARVHFFLGYYYMLSGNMDSTIIQQREAFRIDSGSTINSVWPDASNILANAVLNKASLMLNKNDLSSAKSLILENLHYASNNPNINKTLGNIYLGMNRSDSALYYYNISVSVQPDADVLNNMGVVYLSMSDFKNAIPFLQKALELKPDNKNARMNLYNCYLNIGDKASADKLGVK
jgi:Flp pilus assembly protein TadD